MTYTVSQENYIKAIELLALLNVDLRDMERNDETMKVSYKAKTEKLLDEIALLSLVLGESVQNIDDAVSARALELEKVINANTAFSRIG